MHDDKRELRRLKRELKRAGNKRRRRILKQGLEGSPEDAPATEADFGRYSSAPMNGFDRDSHRRRGAQADPSREGPERSH